MIKGIQIFYSRFRENRGHISHVDGVPPSSLTISIPQNGLTFQLAPTAVPEPSTIALAALGLGGLFVAVKRRRLA